MKIARLPVFQLTTVIITDHCTLSHDTITPIDMLRYTRGQQSKRHDDDKTIDNQQHVGLY